MIAVVIPARDETSGLRLCGLSGWYGRESFEIFF